MAPSLFLAFHRLRRYFFNEKWPRPRCWWALDSGGFNHVRTHGRWTMDARDYAERVWLVDREIGNLAWAAPQDWMCEPDILARTGLTVEEHQRRTVANYRELVEWWWRLEEDDEARWGADALTVSRHQELCPFMPVLQGWTEDDYLRHADMYEAAGIHLPHYQLVGLGSVCRRQATTTIVRLIERIKDELDVDLHGFGVKTVGIRVYGELLASADSHAWSVAGRMRGGACQHPNGVQYERNCYQYALEWRAQILSAIPEHEPFGIQPRPRQMSLW